MTTTTAQVPAVSFSLCSILPPLPTCPITATMALSPPPPTPMGHISGKHDSIRWPQVMAQTTLLTIMIVTQAKTKAKATTTTTAANIAKTAAAVSAAGLVL